MRSVLVILLAAQALELYAVELTEENCADPFADLSLLQVKAEKSMDASHAGSSAMPIFLSTGLADDAAADAAATWQMENVTLAILGQKLMVLDNMGMPAIPSTPAIETQLVVDGHSWKPYELFSNNPDWHASHKMGHWNPDVAPHTWVFGTYHKTGCIFVLQMCHCISGKDANHVRHESEPFSTKPFSNWFFNPDVDRIRLLPDYRFVHLIRNPSDLVVSAYRFHTANDTGEEWLRVPMKDPNQQGEWNPDGEDHFGRLPDLMRDQAEFDRLVPEEHRGLMHRFFESVKAGSSLREFYGTIPAKQGVVLEAYRSLYELQHMTDNYKKTRQDKQSLQMHMEGLKDDYVTTVRCMFSFLHESDPRLDVEWAVNRVDRLNVEKYGSAATMVQHNGHPHMNRNSDDDNLFKVLESVPFLAELDKELSLPAANSC